MPKPFKMVKFKTNVSFVASNGVLYFGGNVVQLPQEDYDGQVDVCKDFGLPLPELIEEIEVVAQEDKSEDEPEGEPEEPKKRGRGRSAAKSEAEAEEKPEAEAKPEAKPEEKPEGESEAKPEEDGEL